MEQPEMPHTEDESPYLKDWQSELVRRLESFKRFVEAKRGTYYNEKDASDLIAQAERVLSTL